MLRKPVVTIYVRHRSDCPHDGKPFFRGCNCTKWLRYSGTACLCGYSHKGNQHRFSADTRSWGIAEEKCQDIQNRLDSGDTSTPVKKPASDSPQTIEQEINTFIRQKEGEGVSNATVRKIRGLLRSFDDFLASRSKFFPNEITAKDVIEFRASWTWKSGVTKQKQQQNLRSFLRGVNPDLLDVLKPIRLSRTDVDRLKPQPFTDDELKRLIAQLPKTFPDDPEKVEKMTALIRCQVMTGLAIRDAIQLERENLQENKLGHWLRIERQKTRKPVRQRLHPSLYKELLGVTNGNPKYIFWNGTSLPTSATGLWQADLRQVMKDCGLWIKGNLSHRFRDTAVDRWLADGWSLMDVAEALGDTVAIVEKAYKSLESKRTEERLAKLPVRAWSAKAGAK